MIGCGTDVLWQLQAARGAAAYRFAPPQLPLAGGTISGALLDVHADDSPSNDASDIVQYSVHGRLAQAHDLTLRITFRIDIATGVVRFRYTLESANSESSAVFARGPLEYLRLRTHTPAPQLREVQLSQFVGLTHSYTLQENDFSFPVFTGGAGVMGPILAAHDGSRTLLLAYEHGSTVPESYLRFKGHAGGEISLSADRANTYPGERIDAAHPWHSIWFQAGVFTGGFEDLAPVYRRFIASGMTAHRETRRPYVFYNTWNYQERQRWGPAKRDYLLSINLDRALREIEVAHQLGIDVYVLDTGWFQRTGDWNVSPNRFPDGLQQVRRKLEGYGMRLGLWFGPTSAAVSSAVDRQHPEWRVSRDGVVAAPRSIWGTEPSHEMCLVSPYSRAFAEKVIAVARATGATYFKWDAVAQHGCNDPHHDHGTEANTPEERENSFAFQMIGRMSETAGRIADAIPGAIVDFDVTETGRAMGLAFLTEGKYFLINNGPYYFDYDVPFDKEHDNWNLFFYPGQARSWIARSPLSFDKWIPSTLFLTHYLPDDPRDTQELNIASMILGQDGLWGDLVAISPEGRERIAGLLRLFKQVRDDMAASDPIVTGLLGGSPEIHEKLSAATGRGAVVVFATAPGRYEYVTKHRASTTHRSNAGVQVTHEPDGRGHILVEFKEPGAKIVFFGVGD